MEVLFDKGFVPVIVEDYLVDLMELGQSYWLLGFWDPLISRTKQNYCQTDTMFKVISLCTVSHSIVQPGVFFSPTESLKADLKTEAFLRNSLLEHFFPQFPLNWHCKLLAILFLLNSICSKQKLHVLLSGPSQSFKSILLSQVSKISKNLSSSPCFSNFNCSQISKPSQLSLSLNKKKEHWTLEAGVLLQARSGFVSLDDIQELPKKVQETLSQSLTEEYFKSENGIRVPNRNSILATCHISSLRMIQNNARFPPQSGISQYLKHSHFPPKSPVLLPHLPEQFHLVLMANDPQLSASRSDMQMYNNYRNNAHFQNSTHNISNFNEVKETSVMSMLQDLIRKRPKTNLTSKLKELKNLLFIKHPVKFMSGSESLIDQYLRYRSSLSYRFDSMRCAGTLRLLARAHALLLVRTEVNSFDVLSVIFLFEMSEHSNLINFDYNVFFVSDFEEFQSKINQLKDLLFNL